jgi:hypothetical protein
VDIFAL